MNSDPDSQKLLLQILLIAVLTAINAFCAASEIAFVSLNKNKVANQAIKGDKSARTVLQLLDHSDDFLATIQVAITFAGFLSSASAANTFADLLAPYLSRFGGGDQLAILIVTILLSFITLVFGELYPKQIGIQKAEAIAFRGAGTVLLLQKIMKPFIRFLSFSTSILEKVTPIAFDEDKDFYTRDEVNDLLKKSSMEGAIEAQEFNMLKGVLSMDDKMAREIMVPRTDTFMIDIRKNVMENIQAALDSPYTRIPVYEEDKDNVIGLLHLKSLLKESRRKSLEQINLLDILNEPLFVPETISIDELLSILKRSNNQLAILHDEYGGVVGVVTLEDILEEIVGDIEDEYDEIYVLFEKINDREYIVDGATPLYRFNEFFGTELDSPDVDTIAGYLLTELGEFPEEGQSAWIEEEGLRIETLSFENHRLLQIKVTYLNRRHNSSDSQNELYVTEENIIGGSSR